MNDNNDTDIIKMDGMMMLLSNRTTYYNNDPYDDTHIKLLEEATKDFAKEHLLPAMASASTSTSLHPVERLDKNDGSTYIRTFLLNTKRNKIGWAVDPETIHKNVLSIIGKPLVIDIDPISKRLDHPHWNSHRSAEASRKSQDAKRVGTVERVFYDTKNDDYYGDIRVT